MSTPHLNFINGEWLAGNTLAPNLNPSNLADVIGEYAQGDAAQLDLAVRAAEAAMAAVAQALLRTEDELLRGYSHLALRNWRGLDVGALRPAAALAALSRA